MIGKIAEVGLTITGAIYLLFVPGFVVSFAFFKPKKIDIIERIALSFALSIALVPLVSFYFNLVGVKISRVSVILETLGIIVVAGIVMLVRRRYDKS